MRPYNDRLAGDDQISAEEMIAFAIREGNTAGMSDEAIEDGLDVVGPYPEEVCAHLGREILYNVLRKFRPDLFHTTVSECVEALRGCLKLIEDEGLDELHGDLAEVVRGIINDAEQD